MGMGAPRLSGAKAPERSRYGGHISGGQRKNRDGMPAVESDCLSS